MQNCLSCNFVVWIKWNCFTHSKSLNRFVGFAVFMLLFHWIIQTTYVFLKMTNNGKLFRNFTRVLNIMLLLGNRASSHIWFTHNTVIDLPYTVMSECVLKTVNKLHTFWHISRVAALQVIPARGPFCSVLNEAATAVQSLTLTLTEKRRPVTVCKNIYKI